MLTKILKKLYIPLICLLSISLGISSQIVNTNSQNYYNNAVNFAKELKDKNICGTDEKYSLEDFYKGLKDKINNQDNFLLKKHDNKKISFSIGYKTGMSSLKKGSLFSPNPTKLYNPRIVLTGISDHYSNTTPKFKLIESTRLREILNSDSQILPKDISADQFNYSLGFNLFEIPKNYSSSNIVNKKSFIEGMKAGLNNEKYNLSKQQVAEFSYIMGAFYSNNLEGEQDKNAFLEGFKSELPQQPQKFEKFEA